MTTANSSWRARRRRRMLTVLFAATTTLVAAGCGSTIGPGVATEAQGPGVEEELSLPDDVGGPEGDGSFVDGGVDGADGPSSGAGTGFGGGDGSGGTADAGGAGGAGSAGGADSARGSAGSRPGSGSTTGSTGGAGGKSAGGATGPVEIGILVDKNFNEFGRQMGAEEKDPLGNNEANAKAVVKQINATGGLGGRLLKPVWGFYDAGTAEPFSAQMERICTTWTQDNKVVAAVSGFLNNEVLHACLAKKNVPFIFHGNFMMSAEEYQKYPLIFTPGLPSLNRMANFWIDRLQAQKYFAPQPATMPTKIGMLWYDTPQQTKIAQKEVKDRLKLHRLVVSEEGPSKMPETADDIATLQSQLQNYALRFKSRDITHVIVLDQGGLAGQFLNAARSVQYFPRMGLTSDSQLAAVAAFVEPQQLKGAMAVGWLPGYDVDRAQDQPTPEAKRCEKLLKAAGQDLSGSQAYAFGMAYCDILFMLQAVANNGGLTSPSGFREAAESLRSSYAPYTTFTAQFGPGRHDGTATMRDLQYRDDCECFHYVGPLRPF